MAESIVRRTMGRGEINAIIATLNATHLRANCAARASAVAGNGTTAGFLRTTVAVDYAVRGLIPAVQLASTDDLWDLSAEVDTTATQFRAYWLFQDGTFLAGPEGTTLLEALEFMVVPDTTLSVIGVYVAGVSCDFDDAGGLAAQGTVYNGVPDGARASSVEFIDSVAS